MLRQSSPLFLHQRTTMKLLVRNLARTTTEHDIRKLFSE
ncbi:RNA recognition motif containing protein, partial [Vibrio metoecus]